MFQPIEDPALSLFERFRQRFGRRLAGILLALLIEAMVLFLIISIGQSISEPEFAEMTTATFDIAPPRADEPDLPQNENDSRPPRPSEPEPAPEAPQPRAAEQPAMRAPPALIPLSPNEMASADIGSLPSRRMTPAPARRSQQGPSAPAMPADTPLAGGTGPNGEPLYAAAWYREPTSDQMRGYLSTADGPGWALIACRTVPEYRLEDCVQLDEYPRNSHIGRSVLAAAWQFRVIPPRVGGQYQVGQWVRIRIDYDITRR